MTAAQCLQDDTTGDYYKNLQFVQELPGGKEHIFDAECAATFNGWTQPGDEKWTYDMGMVLLNETSPEGWMGMAWNWKTDRQLRLCRRRRPDQGGRGVDLRPERHRRDEAERQREGHARRRRLDDRPAGRQGPAADRLRPDVVHQSASSRASSTGPISTTASRRCSTTPRTAANSRPRPYRPTKGHGRSARGLFLWCLRRKSRENAAAAPEWRHVCAPMLDDICRQRRMTRDRGRDERMPPCRRNDGSCHAVRDSRRRDHEHDQSDPLAVPVSGPHPDRRACRHGVDGRAPGQRAAEGGAQVDPAAVRAAAGPLLAAAGSGPEGAMAAVELAADNVEATGISASPGGQNPADYWTPERMRAAKPMPMPVIPEGALPNPVTPGPRNR